MELMNSITLIMLVIGILFILVAIAVMLVATSGGDVVQQKQVQLSRM